MRQQRAAVGAQQQVAREPAQHPFAQAAVAKGSGDDAVGGTRPMGELVDQRRVVLRRTPVERVEHGSHLVDDAGRTMNEIVAAIQRVTDIVGAISSASAEQSTGVSQVGQAIAQMDAATQSNAALVQQGGIAAEALRQQAQELVQAVSVFKLVASPPA